MPLLCFTDDRRQIRLIFLMPQLLVYHQRSTDQFNQEEMLKYYYLEHFLILLYLLRNLFQQVRFRMFGLVVNF